MSQTDQIKNFCETVGELVPWDPLLNPLWDELLRCIEDSWLRCDSFLRLAHTEHSSLGLPTILPQSVTHAQPRVPNIKAMSFWSHTLTNAEGPREEPVTYAGDTPIWRKDPEAQVHLRLSGSGLLPMTGFREQRAIRVRTFKHLAVRLL